MNGEEQATLNELNKKFDAHIKRVEPIIKAYHDQKIVDKFLAKAWRGTVAVLSVLALIGGIWAIFFKD